MAQEGEEGREGARERMATDELLPARVVDCLFDLALWGEMRRKNAAGKPILHLANMKSNIFFRVQLEQS